MKHLSLDQQSWLIFSSKTFLLVFIELKREILGYPGNHKLIPLNLNNNQNILFSKDPKYFLNIIVILPELWYLFIIYCLSYFIYY